MNMKQILDKLLLRSFCCCLPLEKGCQAIGSLEWLLTLYLTCRYADLQHFTCNRPRLGKISCSMIFYNALSFVVSAAIVSGISKRCREYFLPWLLIKTIEYAVFSSIIIYELQYRFVPDSSILIVFAALVPIFLTFWYSWLSVFSLYFRMGETEDMMPLEQNGNDDIPQEV